MTGASSGIGAACARRLSQDGFVVVINYFHSKKDATQLLNQVKEDSPFSKIFKADVSKPDQVKKMFVFIKRCFGRLDVLVNNAGIAKKRRIGELSEQDWDLVMDVNTKSVFLCSQEAVRLMKQNKGHSFPSKLEGMDRLSYIKGKIITIASIAGLAPSGVGVHYAASKAALLGFNRTLAKEVSKEHITVNCIAPGSTETPMLLETFTKKYIEGLEKKIPLGRLGSPDDIAGTVSFLASSDADYITGETIVVDGGVVMR